jgi:hypothetical protein
MAFVGAAPASATTFFNGSFESPGPIGGPGTPGVVAGVRYLGDGDSFIDAIGVSWVHTGTGDASTLYGDFYTNGNGGVWNFAAQDGGLYVGWGASGATGGTLYQTFDTEVGITYLVNYWLSTQEPFDENYPEQKPYVEARDSGNVLLGFVETSLQRAPGWAPGVALAFTATTTSTTLRFIDHSDGGSGPGIGTYNINWALDNVTVDAIPEPGTFALLGFGVGLAALFRKRQSAR